MKKAELRKQASAQRNTLSYAEVTRLSSSLLSNLTLLDLSDVKTLHIFLPITKKKEPDTFLFIDWLAKYHPQIKIIVPKADFETALMTNHVYLGKDDLKHNLYDILEPQKAELHDGDVDMVLIPLLAFDKRGYRVGYGRGFYDRFLQNLTTVKVGISFFDPVSAIEDINEHDIPMDMCVTPNLIYKF